MDSGKIEYLGGAPVTINATNGAVVNATFVIKFEEPLKDSLRRWAEAITMHERFGIPIPEEFACPRRIE